MRDTETACQSTPDKFADSLAYYKSQHRTIGCKLTHMLGVPMIALSVPMVLFNKRAAGQLQIFGWMLQLIGHYVFEGNKPVLLETKSPYTIVAALVFVAEEWRKVAKNEPLVELAPDPLIEP